MTGLAVVSGGGTGIGRATAARLAAGGHEVVLIGRRDQVLAQAAQDIAAACPATPAWWIAADLADPDQVARVGRRLGEVGRPVDVLVNNAGGNLAPQAAADLAGLREDWLANVSGNVLPAVLLTQALLPILHRPGGRIVTVTSVAAFRGPASYGGAKAALHPWTMELAVRLAPEGITVNAVAPGYVPDTEFYGDRMTPAFHTGRSALSPMGRGGRPEEVAAAVLALIGPDSGFVTGQILQVNGGALLGRG